MSSRPAAPPEWISFHVYHGGRVHDTCSDEVLSQAIAPLFATFEVGGLADQAFFIRYADPEPHIRLRVRARPTHLRRSVYDHLSACLSASDRQLPISRIVE